MAASHGSSRAASTSTPSLNDLLGLPPVVDLLEDVDVEGTLLILENAGQSSRRAQPAPMLAPKRPVSTAAQGIKVEPPASEETTNSFLEAKQEDLEPLDLSLANLNDLFPVGEDDGIDLLAEDSAEMAAQGCVSPDVKLRVNTRTSLNSHTGGPELSPVMDSFLRESWDDIHGSVSKSTRNSLKMMESSAGSSASNPGSANMPRHYAGAVMPYPASFTGPLQGHVVMNPAALAPTANATSRSCLKNGTKPPRKAKQCVIDGCTRRAQSNNRCKTHGGGARCQVEGCDKSSQGGGLCRAHGGGKKCRIPGCTKGTQRLGLCYLHGGIRRCIMEGCKKKDRGNGYCISHGGGRRCEVPGCNRSVRKGNHCQAHQAVATLPVQRGQGDQSPFMIARSLLIS